MIRKARRQIRRQSPNTIYSGHHHTLATYHSWVTTSLVSHPLSRFTHIIMTLSIVKKFKWKFVARREKKALLNIVYWLIKILTLQGVPIMIVLAIHRMKIVDETIFNEVLKELLLWIGVNWRPLFPVILCLLIELVELFLPVGWCLIDWFKHIGVLALPKLLIKILFVLCMVCMVIFTWWDVAVVHPMGSLAAGARRDCTILVNWAWKHIGCIKCSHLSFIKI